MVGSNADRVAAFSMKVKMLGPVYLDLGACYRTPGGRNFRSASLWRLSLSYWGFRMLNSNNNYVINIHCGDFLAMHEQIVCFFGGRGMSTLNLLPMCFIHAVLWRSETTAFFFPFAMGNMCACLFFFYF